MGIEMKVPTVPEGYPLREAYALLSRSPIESLPVMENGGRRVVGLLTAENVGELLLIRSAEEAGRPPHGVRRC